MKFTELKNEIVNGAASVYLLEGDDGYFRSKGEDMIKSAFLQMPELNFTAFEGESLHGQSLSALVTAVKNFPFMAEKRIIKVREFYPTETEYENFIKPLLEDFPSSSILIIVNSESKKGVDLKRKHAVTYVDCNKTDREAVARWAYVTMRRAGITAPVSACEKIADYCLCDMARVSSEVQKIIDYKIEGALTDEEVEELVFKDADYRLYELTNTVALKRYSAFCEIADEILRKGGDETYILNGLLNYFKNLLTISSSYENDAYLANLLKMKEYGVKKSREQARAIGETRLENLVAYTYARISDVKGGRLTPQSALQNVKNAIFFDDEHNI